MKLYILEDKKVQLKELNALQMNFQTKHFNFSVVIHKNKYLLHTGIDIFASSNELKTNDFTQLRDSKGHLCELLLVESSASDETYQKYQLKDITKINSSLYSDMKLPSYYPFIDIDILYSSTCIVASKTNKLVSLNGELLEHDTKYNFMDELLIGGTRIIFMDEAIMVNCNKHVTVHLPLYEPKQSENHLKVYPIKNRIYNRIPQINNSFEYSFQMDNKFEPIRNDRSLLLVMAPTLLMSAASLSVGFITTYNGYISGRDIYTLLPMLILPSVMFFSTLIFQPLNKWSEKRNKRKQKLQKEGEQQKIIESIQKDYLEFTSSYEINCDNYFPSPKKLEEKLISDDYLNIDTKLENLYVRIGTSTNQIHPLNKNIQGSEDIKFENEICLPFLINLAKYNTLKIIVPNHDISFFKYLLLQFETHYELPIIILCKDEFINQSFWIRKLCNTRINGNRYIVTKRDKIYTILSKISVKPLIISYYSEIIVSNKTFNIIFTDTDTKLQSDISINLGELNGYDYLTKSCFHFLLEEPLTKDISYLLLQARQNIAIAQNHDFFSVNSLKNINPYWIEETWKQNRQSKSLKGLLGIGNNTLIDLDISEGKDGPHGLIAGTTGSGKTELLLSWIVSLSLRYSYEDVQFAYVDFKGGGGANSLKGLPHLIGTLSNLDTNQIERALISFKNECLFRQECFTKMNSLTNSTIMNIDDYRNNDYLKFGLPKLADLIIIVDEFAELKNEYPEFMKDLISISRIGRSLGVHLILCTQKPAGVISEEIWSNCNFKICLKVLEKSDSQEVIHCQDAYYLSKPGEFILLSNGCYKKGVSAYINEKGKPSIHDVKLVNIDGSTTLINNRDNTKTQLFHILEEFKKIKTNPIRPLWLPIINRTEYNPSKHKDSVGLVDDFYQCKQYLLKMFDKKQSNGLIISTDINEKKNFFTTILSSFISNIDKDSQLFVIDDIFMSFNRIYDNCSFFSEYLSSDNEEKIINLFKYMNKPYNSQRYLIITDISRFYDTNENYKSLLRQLLERSNQFNVSILIFSSSIMNLSYRDLSFINNRYCLKLENIQEIQTLFETNEKKIQKDDEWGMIKTNHLLRFRYYYCDYKQLLQYSIEYKNTHPNKDRFTIPCIPNHLNRQKCNLSIIPIGISYQTYNWITLKPTESIYVVSLYKDEFIPYKKEMSMYAKCTDRLSMDEEDGQLIFLSLDEYRHKHNHTYPVLYIGTSYRQQFYFHSKITDLKENQGLLMKNYESELLKVL